MTMPTADEIQRVREWECSMRSHGWTTLEVVGLQDPVQIVCSNCGRSLDVVPKP